jgi:hypothetical protein
VNLFPKNMKQFEERVLELERVQVELTEENEDLKKTLKEREEEFRQILFRAEEIRKQQVKENKVLARQKENLIEEIRKDHMSIIKSWLKKGTRSEAEITKKKNQLEKRIRDTLGKRSKKMPRQV